jgi:UDP-N-acetylglucosamine--N-acetylmuramyl-(pentapeptide) pyrophosphoryl-undecaprenol N-acetylglucosamine transferase
MGRKNIVMTGGGTGGHLAIIAALKEALKKHSLIYIGSTNGQDRAWFENDHDFLARYFFETKGVANRSFLGKFDSMFDISKATKKAAAILEDTKADVVFSVGGYSAAPCSFGAVLTSTPLVIHEQNAIPGSLNKLLRPLACSFISSFGKAKIAYPIKNIFFEKARVRKEIKTVIFLGGSQGAVAINEFALLVAKDLYQKGIKIIHQAGERNIQKVKEEYQKLGIKAEVFGFSKKLVDYIVEADFAIARAGASTLWELSANGLPTLFVPYPYAYGDHQYYNAKFLADQGLGWVCRQNQLSKSKLFEILENDISQISKNLIDFTPKDGSKQIAQIILECAK